MKLDSKQATKADLEELRSNTKADIKLENTKLRTEIEDMFTEFTGKMFSYLDPLMKDLEVRQQERELEADQYHKTQKTLKNHEKRITKLEGIN